MPSPATLVARIDGASRGNPGPAAFGVVIEDDQGQVLEEISRRLGETTNNVAEYHALLAALEYALAHAQRLRVFSDSELLVRQLQGHYKVKSPDLQPLFARAQEMIRRLERFQVAHVPREQNRRADALANAALDHGQAPRVLRGQATFRAGALHPREPLPLAEGEEVELEIRRKTRG